MSPADGTFVGVLQRRGRFAVVEPLFERGRRETVNVRRRADVSIGDMVLVRAGRGRVPEVVRALGRPDSARDVVEALLVDRGHARRFPDPAEQEAQAAARREDTHGRRDLTTRPTFTIDPTDARDFDDALSVERHESGFDLYVHIADVSAYVEPGTVTDTEAYRRGNSVYVPGSVEPMLPAALSSDACSLVPGAPRKAVTVEMRVDPSGRSSRTAFYRSLIRSDQRFAYEQVDRIFAGAEVAPEPVAEPLAAAREIAASLRRGRIARGALGIETSEPEFEFDSNGNVVSAKDDVQMESHGLIEELMILANEEVARRLEQGRVPTLYRVHEQPDPAAVEFLVAQLESLDVPTPPLPGHITSRAASELVGRIGAMLLEHMRRNGGGRALTSLVLRALEQAHYSPRNLGHAGLASPAYCHFTSPIRRFPDLIVHRALLAAVGAGEHPPPPAPELAEAGRHCSQTEREAMAVEREADDVCLAFLLERRLNEEGWETALDGEVSGVISAGAFVSFEAGLGGAACEGFLPARRMRGDYYELNEVGTALVGRSSSHRIRLGDPIEVRVGSIDPPRGRIDLVPAEIEGEQHGRSRR